MLKVEKLTRSKEVSIALRKTEGFFNPTFLRAFLWASTFHLGAVVFFHIAPFTLVSGRIFPPAFVESDLFDGGAAIAAIDPEGPPKRYLLLPKESRPELPSLPRLTMMQRLENIQECQSETNPFFITEQEFWAEKIFKPHGKSIFLPVEIQSSGLLAECPFTLKETTPNVQEPFKAIYKVQVENKTGTIFWYEPKIVPESQRLLVEKVLRSIQFIINPKGFTTSGEIEITFNQRRVYD